MPYRVTPEAHFIRIEFFGQLAGHELMDALREVEALEVAGAPVAHRLTDLTGIEHSAVKADDVRTVAERRVQRHFPNPFRSAIVAPQPAQFGYARMFQALNDHPNITIQVFPTVAAASAWLCAETAAK